MPVPTVSAVVSAHDRREFLAEAVRSAADDGADEVIVVRNFADPLPGLDGRYREIRCDAAPTGEKQARGVEAATGDLVAFLDDDDRWRPGKVEAVREAFRRRPDLVYFNHAQRPIDAVGRPVTAAHPEYAAKDPGRFATTDPSDLATLVDRVWPGNSSSTVVRRSWAVPRLPELREAAWSCDLYWFVAALLSGRGVEIVPDAWVDLRLHGRNMSQTRGSGPEEFRHRHGEASARFAHAYGVFARLARDARGPTSPMVRYLKEQEVAFSFFADLEAGRRPRRAAARMIRRGPGLERRGALGAAWAALVAPSLARSLLYRSSVRRWQLGSAAAAGTP